MKSLTPNHIYLVRSFVTNGNYSLHLHREAINFLPLCRLIVLPASSSLNFPLELKVNELMRPIPLGARAEKDAQAEVLALKHESSILKQWFNPVPGSRKSQASSP